MRPPRGRLALALIFALLAVDAWRQVVADGLLAAREPLTLTALKVVAGTAAAGASWGSWRGAPWAPAAAASWGVAIAVLLVALEPVLGLGPEARRGLWTGAAAVLGIGLGSAWYLRRVLRPGPTREPTRTASS